MVVLNGVSPILTKYTCTNFLVLKFYFDQVLGVISKVLGVMLEWWVHFYLFTK